MREQRADILNITVRSVSRDEDSALAYARDDVFAAVMFFEEDAGSQGDERQRILTSALINAALDHGGTFYLPYRLHATQEQMERAYPQLSSFFETRARLDPEIRFSNYLSRKYGPLSR